MPQVLLLVERRYSSCAAVGLEAEEPLLEAQRLAADVALERAVADHAPDPVVQAVAEVVRPGVRVDLPRVPAGEQFPLLVGLAVAVGVLEEPGAAGSRGR